MYGSWMKTGWDFGLPYRIFTIGPREATTWKEFRDILGLPLSPELIEKAVIQLVTRLRPDLIGGFVVSIEAKWSIWQIGYVHPSFPRRAAGYLPEEEPLVPQADDSEVV